jgi:Tol biopolymer transport system component
MTRAPLLLAMSVLAAGAVLPATSVHAGPPARVMLLAPTTPGQTGMIVASPDGSNPRSIGKGYLVLDADLSPDGQTVAFSGHRNGDWNVDIFTVAASGGNPTRITTHDAWDDTPAWSPDGTQIAYSTGMLDEQPFRDIAVVRASGGAPRYVTDASAALTGNCPVGHRINRPAWLPDGARLLVSDQCDAGWPDVTTTNSTKVISAVPGKTLTTINGVWDADLSPNGREIAGVTYPGGKAGVSTVISRFTIDGRRIADVTTPKTGVGIFDPVYSPGGSRIAYRKAVGADSTAWTSGIAGGTVRKVPGDYRVLDWSSR